MLVKKARSLRQERGRSQTGDFLVEGVHHVGAAIEAGWEIEFILYAPDQLSSAFGRDLVSRFPGRCEPVSPDVLASVAEKQHPQGIVAVARQRHLRLDITLPGTCGIAVVSPQDPGNLGTMVRTLDGVGGGTMFILDGGVDPYHPTAIRAGMGSTFVVPLVQCGFADFVKWATRNNVQIIGSSARATVDYRDADPKQPWILLLGSEQKGLSEEQRAACDSIVFLPMRGRVSSLNLAVAAGILMYEWVT